MNNALKKYMEAVGYRITEGDKFGWPCWGSNAYWLSSWNGEYDGHSAGITFDTSTGVTYEITLCDYSRNRAYRWLNPDFKDAYVKYAQGKDTAWDDVKYIDLDLQDDILEKMRCVFAGLEYDDRVKMELELDDDTFMLLAKAAHSRDITINKMIESVLEEAIRNDNT